MSIAKMFVRLTVALLIAATALAACGSDDEAPRPQTEPIDPGTTTQPPPATSGAAPPDEQTYALGEKFTVTWTEATEPPAEINLTIAVTAWRCGDKTMADLQRAAQAAQESYGEFADPAPNVAAGYQLCVAAMKISNTGKMHLQHAPVMTALDAAEVEYNQDDGLTDYIGHGATANNRETYGGATVDLNPRETASTAVAFQIPADTTINHLRYTGSDQFDPPPTAIALIKVA